MMEGAANQGRIRKSPVSSRASRNTCIHCSCSLEGKSAFELGKKLYCFRCVLHHQPLVRRSIYTAIIVGTILVGINQGTLLAHGAFPSDLMWKVPLTYVVPFCVASWGALSNGRTEISPEDVT